MDKRFYELISQIPCLHTQRHAHVIYGLIRWLQPPICVEIGSFQGYMTSVMAKAIDDNPGQGILYAIDNFSLGNNPIELHNRLASLQLSDRVVIMGGDSKDESLWPGQVDFAFIDGNHSFEGCERDMVNAFVRGAKCIAIHDTVSWWGPRECTKIERVMGQNVNMIEVPFDSGLAIFMPTLTANDKPPVLYSQENYPEGYVK